MIPAQDMQHRTLLQRIARQAMLDNAMSENAVDLMLEMYDAVETGKLQTIEPRSTKTTTPTTLTEFARDVMLPLIAEPVNR